MYIYTYILYIYIIGHTTLYYTYLSLHACLQKQFLVWQLLWIRMLKKKTVNLLWINYYNIYIIYNYIYMYSTQVHVTSEKLTLWVFPETKRVLVMLKLNTTVLERLHCIWHESAIECFLNRVAHLQSWCSASYLADPHSGSSIQPTSLASTSNLYVATSIIIHDCENQSYFQSIHKALVCVPLIKMLF